MTTTTSTTTPAQAAAAANAPPISTSSTGQAVGTDATQQLASNFNSFLTLLTTQLQNQDPLDPLDTNQFTQQLVEFTSVQQQVNMTPNLQPLITCNRPPRRPRRCSSSAPPSPSPARRRRLRPALRPA